MEKILEFLNGAIELVVVQVVGGSIHMDEFALLYNLGGLLVGFARFGRCIGFEDQDRHGDL